MKKYLYFAKYYFKNLVSNKFAYITEFISYAAYILVITQLFGYIFEGKVLISESNKLKRALEFDNAGNPISTKEDKNKHGFGSKNIRAVVEKYGGELRYHIENDMFTIEIIL